MSNPFRAKPLLFSVIAPVYKDRWETFPKFFGALHEQEYKDFEVIVVFDGENPLGRRELKKMMRKYPQMVIREYTQEWGGAPKARNLGAAMSEGDILLFADPDVYYFPESLRVFVSKFEENPHIDVVWGLYDIDLGDRRATIGGSVPVDASGRPVYWAFRSSNYCSGGFPVRKKAFVGWDERCKSLQDWDMWVRMLKKDNFEGKNFHYIPRAFFITDQVRQGGISDDSHKNWKERVRFVKEKNGIPLSDIVVCSLGAPFHGIHAAKKIGADYLPMPSYKPHDYKLIYLLGFYPGPRSTRAHLSVFEGDGKKSKKVIHWIGTDTYKMRTEVPFVSLKYLKELWKKQKVVQLVEAKHMQEEMAEIGIKTEIVPIPPQKLYEPMPLPKEFSVAIYENATQNMYAEDLMEEVARSMPDVKFYFFGNDERKGMKTENTEHLGWIDLDEWMPKFSLNLRITTHDGLPLTPLQFLTAGRPVVTNTPFFGAQVVKADRKEIIEAIRNVTFHTKDSETYTFWKKALDFDTYKKAITDLV